jgi:hypothetical protein
MAINSSLKEIKDETENGVIGIELSKGKELNLEDIVIVG